MDFQTIYKRYYREVFYYCNKLLYSNHLVDHKEYAQDFVQEAFTSAWAQWNTFYTEQNVKSFLYIVVKNKAFNQLQQIKRHTKSHKEIAFLSHEGELPDYLAMNADIIGFILDQLESLPPQCAIIVKLYFNGFTSHEIATKLHITAKTALNQKLKGIGLLKHKLHLKYG